MRLRLTLPFTLALLVTFPATAGAADGQIELNQALATSTGVYQTILISRPGSYKLTSNLVVPIDTNGIQIIGENVSLDLNGFTIQGPGTGGVAHGISAATTSHLQIRNGTVRDFKSECFRLGTSARVENISALSCGGDGIRLGFNGRVDSSFSASHSGTGIVTADQGAVEHTVSQFNGDSQISVGESSRVERCNVDAANATLGIVVGDGGVISNNTVRIGNSVGKIGISSGDGATIDHNTIRRTLGAEFGGSAIVTGEASVVEANAVYKFTRGLQASGSVVARGNSFVGLSGDANGFGIFVDAGGLSASVIENNLLISFTVGASLGGHARFAGNTLRSSNFPGSIGLNVVSVSTAISGNVFRFFTTNLQGPIVEIGTNLYDGSTTP